MGKRISFLFFLFLSHSAVAAETLPPVVVSGKKVLEKSLSTGPKSVITRQELLDAGISNLTQALQSLGVVQLHETTGNGSRVSVVMRGFGENASSNSLFLINGMPITNPDLASPDLNIIPLNEVESIEVIAGSEAVLYGDQAVGGAINIITREKHLNQYELSCGLGSYQNKNCSFGFHNAAHGWRYDIALTGLDTKNYRQNNAFEQNRIYGRLSRPYAQGQVAFDYNLTSELMQYPGGLTHAQVEQNRRQSKNHTDFFRDKNKFLHLREQHFFTDNWRLEVDGLYRGLCGKGILTSPFKQRRAGSYLKSVLYGRLFLTDVLVGIDGQNDYYQLKSSFGTTQDSLQKYSLFTLINHPYYAWIFSLGMRVAQQRSHLRSYVNTDQQSGAMASTLGATYVYNPKLQFYARRAGSFRFPKADENAATLANVKGLKTQRGISYEAGMRVTQLWYAYKFEIYQLNLRDEIAFDPLQTPTNPWGTNRNYPPTSRKGMSLSGDYQVSSRFIANGQFNYVLARFQNGLESGKRIPMVSEGILRLGLNYRISCDLNLYLEGLYTGSQFAANDVFNISQKLGGYTLYNLNLRFNRPQYSVSLHLNNITNKPYYFYAVYQSFGNVYYPAPERNVMLIVNYVI